MLPARSLRAVCPRLAPAGAAHCRQRGTRKGQTSLFAQDRETWVVLVGQYEGIGEETGENRIVLTPGTLQPIEHLARLLAQGIDVGNEIRLILALLGDVIPQRPIGLVAIGTDLLRQ